MINQIIQVWINYYGKYIRKYIGNFYKLLAKYKTFRYKLIKIILKWLENIADCSTIFYHWQIGFKIFKDIIKL